MTGWVVFVLVLAGLWLAAVRHAWRYGAARGRWRAALMEGTRMWAGQAVWIVGIGLVAAIYSLVSG